MLRFLLEGSLGDILAPVTGTLNQLNLAIQHQRNNEITAILAKESVDFSKLGDSGYGAIHVACRYNNRFAFELILGRGIPLNLPDCNKNAPLHYAAKYGNVDLCKILVEKGASVVVRNDQGQTPYDVAENHTVRQFLLPLQLQAERQAAQETYSFAPSAQIYQPVSYAATQSLPPQGQYPTPPLSAPSSSDSYLTQNSSNPPTVPPASCTSAPPSIANAMPPPIFVPPPLNLGRQASPSTSTPEDAAYGQFNPVTPSTTPTTPLTPAAALGPAVVPSKPAPVARQVSGGRTIQADGFHSSASDPNLQVKYGHIKEVINIAPPPTGPIGPGPVSGGPVQYSMFAGQAANGPPNYNRYVAYDANAMYQQQPPQQPPSYGMSFIASQPPVLPTYSSAAPPTRIPAAAPMYQQPPSFPQSAPPVVPPGMTQSSVPVPPPLQPPVASAGIGGSAPVAASPHRSLDVLGNRTAQQNIFSPDAEIVTFDSSSKSVL